ncbi:hypothetical protein [Streptomyces prasinopilosus]|nr:hypothetical protein [Streptomyces prasinopilosus]
MADTLDGAVVRGGGERETGAVVHPAPAKLAKAEEATQVPA